MDDSIDNNDVVPDSLLAFAKDHRYIQTCQDLIEKVFLAPKKEAWWWSLLLYATLVVQRNETTLGMDFMGLQHAKPNSCIAQRRIFKIVLAAGWAMWARLFILRMKYTQEEEDQRHEQLRGAARQYFYQEQRRAMMQRARGGGQTRTRVQPVNPAAAHDATKDWMEQMENLLKRGIQIMSEALSSIPDNPHSLPDSGTLISIGRWVMRLHVAHYCMTGKFPTVWHRLLTQKVERRQDSSSRRIANPSPTTHKLVGQLIIIQAGATLAQVVSRWLVSYLAKRTLQQQENEHNTDSNDIGKAFDTVTDSSMHHCGICRIPRLHSAAPKSCGHVFCWKCLYQWVSTVRPSCPLCRVPCRPQDILALHNY